MIKIPKLIRWIFWTGIIFLIFMTLFRIGFYAWFSHAGNPPATVGGAFVMGLRYDIKMLSIFLALLLLLGCLNWSDPFLSRRSKALDFFLVILAALTMMFFYVVDFAHYAYLSQRLGASVLNYLQDAGISLSLVYQTYPVIRLILFIIAGTWLISWLVFRSYKKILATRESAKGKNKGAWVAGAIVLLAIGIMGRVGQYPLRWSDAFALGNDYRASLALNPFQSFFSSLKFRTSTFNLSKTKEAYPRLEKYFGFPVQADSLNYTRTTTVLPAASTKPNIVIVICESFSAYKSSMWGNPLNTTPFFKQLCDSGIFFDHCFTPSYGTARGVWAVVTGIPDVGQATTTTSRNPAAVDQHTILNDFDGYKKMYFLGGSTSWANIRGLLENNIKGLRIYEQEDYSSPKVDVWGISDKNLFLEANKVLAKQTTPFVTIIQTSDNHRPYTIPSEDAAEFPLRSLPADSLKAYGFASNAEMNAFRYTDFCYQKFITAAKKEAYFANTIFLFIGDHGIAGDAGNMFPRPWTDERLTNMHVPLLIYAPGRIQPKRISLPCSQVDMLPTAASLAHISYTNTTLGRNILDTGYTADKAFAFLYDPEQGYIGVLKGSYVVRTQLQTKKQQVASVVSNDPLSDAAIKDSLPVLTTLTQDIYETARYLLLNNKKKF